MIGTLDTLQEELYAIHMRISIANDTSFTNILCYTKFSFNFNLIETPTKYHKYVILIINQRKITWVYSPHNYSHFLQRQSICWLPSQIWSQFYQDLLVLVFPPLIFALSSQHTSKERFTFVFSLVCFAYFFY